MKRSKAYYKEYSDYDKLTGLMNIEEMEWIDKLNEMVKDMGKPRQYNELPIIIAKKYKEKSMDIDKLIEEIEK